MKKTNFIILTFLIGLTALGQDNEIYFNQALEEITSMFEDRQPVSFKRAVYLTENAYSDGKLDYNEYCREIDKMKSTIQYMITSNNLQQQKTAGNYAIFSYMTEKLPENGFRKMEYDIQSLFDQNNMHVYFVSNLLKTKTGNCHSLPYLYKILSDEINVKTYVSTAPLHIFIKFRDELGKWWNFELTTGTFARTGFLIEAFKVTDAGIESGLYMSPLDGKDLLTLCLCDLVDYYHKKTGKYYGEFVHNACNIGIKYRKATELQLWKADAIKYDLTQKMLKKGLTEYKQISPYPELTKMYDEMEQKLSYIKEMGYYKMLPQEYREKIQEIEAGKFN